MSDVVTIRQADAGSGVCPPGWYEERARSLVAEHAELFRNPVMHHARRAAVDLGARPTRRRSPQLRLPLRPTMRR